jgi:hypothetical protein
LNIPHFSSLVKQMPFVIKSIDLVLHPPAEANPVVFENVAPDILQSFDDDFSETVRIHVSMKAHELAEELAKHGFSASGLPPRMGGTARIKPLMAWLEGKCSVASRADSTEAAICLESPVAHAQGDGPTRQGWDGTIAAKSHRQRTREKANLEYLKITADNLKHTNRAMKLEAARLEVFLGAANKEVAKFFGRLPSQRRVFTMPPPPTQPFLVLAHAPSPFVPQVMPGFDPRRAVPVAPTGMMLHQHMGPHQAHLPGANIAHLAGPDQLLFTRNSLAGLDARISLSAHEHVAFDGRQRSPAEVAAASLPPYQQIITPAAEDPRRTAYLQLFAQDRLALQQRQQSELATLLSFLHRNR